MAVEDDMRGEGWRCLESRGRSVEVSLLRLCGAQRLKIPGVQFAVVECGSVNVPQQTQDIQI